MQRLANGSLALSGRAPSSFAALVDPLPASQLLGLHPSSSSGAAVLRGLQGVSLSRIVFQVPDLLSSSSSSSQSAGLPRVLVLAHVLLARSSALASVLGDAEQRDSSLITLRASLEFCFPPSLSLFLSSFVRSLSLSSFFPTPQLLLCWSPSRCMCVCVFARVCVCVSHTFLSLLPPAVAALARPSCTSPAPPGRIWCCAEACCRPRMLPCRAPWT